MNIVVKIPKEFEEEFNRDKFEDSLSRVASDIESFGFQLAGRYELETIKMLREAFKNGKPLPKGHGRLIDISEYEKYFNTAITYDDGNHIHVVYTNIIPTIIEGSDSECQE